MPLKESYIYPYTGYRRTPSHCHIAVYEHAGNTIVVCTELPDNPGISITNMAEFLATDLWLDLGTPPLARFVWLEHCLAGVGWGEEETFDRVTFELATWSYGEPAPQQASPTVLRQPTWERIDQPEVENLIGEAYTPPDLSTRERSTS